MATCGTVGVEYAVQHSGRAVAHRHTVLQTREKNSEHPAIRFAQTRLHFQEINNFGSLFRSRILGLYLEGKFRMSQSKF
jgi:hypothetical protein